MSHRWRREGGDSPEVNLTALIDVVFLLLIFFMVSTTFERESELRLKLPEASAEAPEEATPRVINVQLDSAGRLFVDERQLADNTPTTLRSALRAAQARNDQARRQAVVRTRQAGAVTGAGVATGQPPIVISADAQAPLQSLVTVLDVARQLGMTDVTFPTRLTNAATDELVPERSN